MDWSGCRIDAGGGPVSLENANLRSSSLDHASTVTLGPGVGLEAAALALTLPITGAVTQTGSSDFSGAAFGHFTAPVALSNAGNRFWDTTFSRARFDGGAHLVGDFRRAVFSGFDPTGSGVTLAGTMDGADVSGAALADVDLSDVTQACGLVGQPASLPQGYRISEGPRCLIPPSGPDLVIAPATPERGRVKAAYSTTLTASGGRGALSWSLVEGGALPPGLSLSGNIISGTPTRAGSSTFTVKVTDGVGSTATAEVSITIEEAAPLTAPAATSTQGRVGVAYSTTLTASGGSGALTWSLAGGQSLPAGLALTEDTISGTPERDGSSAVVVTATDETGASATTEVTINIGTADSDLVLTAATPTSGTVGVPYSMTMTVTGGRGALTWSIAGGQSLPEGLSLSGDTISGTPIRAQSTTFTVAVRDGSLARATARITITIEQPDTDLVIDPADRERGTVGVPYSTTLTASGGTGALTWSIVGGQSLPAGLSLAQDTISGTPTQAGSSTVTVRVTDAAGTSASAHLTWTIDPARVTWGVLLDAVNHLKTSRVVRLTLTVQVRTARFAANHHRPRTACALLDVVLRRVDRLSRRRITAAESRRLTTIASELHARTCP